VKIKAKQKTSYNLAEVAPEASEKSKCFKTDGQESKTSKSGCMLFC